MDQIEKTREEKVLEAMKLFGFSRSDAEFYVAMELGEINGDVDIDGVDSQDEGNML